MREDLFAAAALAILAWLFGSHATTAAPRVTSTLEIDANVESPTFGEPLSSSTTVADANHARLVDLVAQSNQAIANYDAANPGALD
jgi:hypothetical protein